MAAQVNAPKPYLSSEVWETVQIERLQPHFDDVLREEQTRYADWLRTQAGLADVEQWEPLSAEQLLALARRRQADAERLARAA